jgi:hypothetical protein
VAHAVEVVVEDPTKENLRSSADNLRPSEPVLSRPSGRVEGLRKHRKKKRGGRRPGAGAPKGNFNALKHGRYSRQFAELGALFAQNPKLGEAMNSFAERYNLKVKNAEGATVEYFGRVMRRARDIAEGRIKEPFLPDDLKGLLD